MITRAKRAEEDRIRKEEELAKKLNKEMLVKQRAKLDKRSGLKKKEPKQDKNKFKSKKRSKKYLKKYGLDGDDSSDSDAERKDGGDEERKEGDDDLFTDDKTIGNLTKPTPNPHEELQPETVMKPVAKQSMFDRFVTVIGINKVTQL